MTFWLCSDLGCFSFDLDFDRFCFLLDVLLVRLPAVAAATDLTFRFGMVLSRFEDLWRAFGWQAIAYDGKTPKVSIERVESHSPAFEIHRHATFSLHELFGPPLKRSNPTRSLAFNPIFLSSQIQTRAQSKRLPNANKINRLFVSDQTTKQVNSIYFQSTSRPSLNQK